ncbi:MAG: hypothetical protein E7515_01795 [Ruminococcaceae bacterium]|jgi:hypothetical protein|nr:hypothetical protein [Oscillospiraceae bacterium]
MDNKKTIIIVVSIISATIIILALIFAFVFLGSISIFKKNKPEIDTNITTNSNNLVETLPQIERDKGEEYEGKDPFDENILDGAKVIGIYDTYGNKSATIQTTRKTYTVYEGDTLGDSDWVVSEITDNTVTFVSGDKTLTLTKE